MRTMLETGVYLGLALGCAVLLSLLRRRKTRAGSTLRLIEASLGLMAIWLLALGSLVQWGSAPWPSFIGRRTAQIGLVVLALILYEAARAFAMRPRRWLWRAVLALILIAAALVLDIYPHPLRVALAPLASLGLPSPTPAALVLFAAWLFFTGGALWTSLSALRHAAGVQHANRIRHLLLALTCVLAGDLLLWLVTPRSSYWMRPAGSLGGLALRLLGLELLAFAVLRHQLPDTRRLFLRGVRSALLSGLLLAILTLGIVLTGAASSTWQDGLALARRVAVALAAGSMLAVFILPRLRRVLDSALFGGEDELRTALRLHSQQVNQITDLDRLTAATLDWVARTLHVKRSAFVLLSDRGEEGVEFRIACARSVPDLPSMVFSRTSRFFVHLRNTGRPLSMYDLDMIEWFSEVPAAERRWLDQLGVEVFVPVLVASRPAALLALGAKGGKQVYTDRELETLLILAGQTGIALDNARLLDDLRHVQDDLDTLGSQLEETNQQLQRLDQAKTDFVAIAAHELRTPLSQIYGYSDVLTSLKSAELNDTQMVHQFIDGISRGAMRLKRVIDAMIDMSLIETASLMLQPVVLPLPVVVKNAVDSARAAAGQRRLSFLIQDLSHLPYVEADSARLEQALGSVVNNAVKFTPDGGEITISGRTLAPVLEREYVELQIRDTGIGIDADKQELVFSKFYRGENLLQHSSSDARFKGAGPGLGLAIAKGIIEAHGGQIWVESPGRDEEKCLGSTFFIRLPVTQPKE